jgi:DNA repair protein RadC
MEKSAPVSEYKAIKEWKEDERPRERLSKHGAETLSDAELLAIIISSGTKGFSALDVGRSLLENFQSISNLAFCDISELKKIKGLGPARSVTLAAVFELAKRLQTAPFAENKSISSPEEVARYFIPRLQGEKKEKFYTLLLNSKNRVFREVLVSEGTLNNSIVHPREVFKIAISESAASIILLHNHPSGNAEPSKEDINVTRNLVDAGIIIDIKVLDHIIIAGNTFKSFLQLGLI